MEGLEEMHIDVVAGRDVDWNGWIQTLLLEGLEETSIGVVDCFERIIVADVVVDCSDRCCWKEFGRNVNWKGWIRTLLLEATSIGRVGSDVVVGRVGFDVVAGRRLEVDVVDCSD